MLLVMKSFHSTAGIILAFVATAAFGQLPAGPRGGGLVPGGTGGGWSGTGLTKDELIRSWDLDGDGTISKSEADLARARMRRQRLEMQLGGGMDPLTGLPRSGEEPGDDDGEPLFQLPPETSPPAARSRPENSLPGMSPPSMSSPSMAIPSPAAPGPTAPGAGRPAGAEPDSAAAVERSGRASWLPPRQLSPTTTGGLRAGAPAAAPGYGGRSRSDLNAARLPADRLVPAPTRGGLVPSTRPPGTTGALILPGQALRPTLPSSGRAVPLPPPPPSLSPSPPRITAEEMGGYRP
jgi:hypothetical protein